MVMKWPERRWTKEKIHIERRKAEMCSGYQEFLCVDLEDCEESLRVAEGELVQCPQGIGDFWMAIFGIGYSEGMGVGLP